MRSQLSCGRQIIVAVDSACLFARKYPRVQRIEEMAVRRRQSTLSSRWPYQRRVQMRTGLNAVATPHTGMQPRAHV